MSIRTRGAALALCLCLMTPPIAIGADAGNPDTYTFDKQQTNITFSWGHLGISRQSARLLDVDGRLEFDTNAAERSSIEVTMKVASIWSGVGELDRQLKSSDYFNAFQFPTMTFKSTAVRTTGEKTGEVTGDLTILGQARPVTLAVIWNFGGEHPLSTLNPAFKDKFVSGFTATTKLLRSEWGMTRGTPLTTDEIEITINTEMIRKPSPQ